LRRTLRCALLLSAVCLVLAAFSSSAEAQKIDIAFGVSTTDSPGASQASGNHNPASLTGGAYPGFSGDFLFWHNLGFGGEVFWKGSQGPYPQAIYGSGVNYRPVFYNFNAVYAPKLASHVYAEIVGGIGAQDTHYYQCTFGTATSCGGTQQVSSSNHFDADFGGGIKFYPKGGFFIRPEARIYFVNNNTDYSSYHTTRYGVSIGYTFR